MSLNITDIIARAKSLQNKGMDLEAIDLYKEAILIDPKNNECVNNLGVIYLNATKLIEAESLFLNYLSITEGDTKTYNHYSIVLLRTGRAHQAVNLLEYTLSLNPFLVETHLNLCAIYNQIGDLEKALSSALKSIELAPERAEGHNNLGSSFNSMALFDEAEFAFETALACDPNNIEAFVNLGAIKSNKNDSFGSIKIYEKALRKLKKDSNIQSETIKFYLSFEYFKIGKLNEAWRMHESGFHPNVPTKNGRAPRRTFNVPKWDGSPLEKKTLLIWREQGLGDEIMYLSIIPDVLKICKNVIIEVDARLVSTIQRSFPNAIVRVQSYRSEPLYESVYNDYDYHIPLASLGNFFRSSINKFKNSGPFIKFDPSKFVKFSSRLSEYNDMIKVGICWRSGIMDPLRNLTYLNILDCKNLFALPNVAWVNLQYGDCEEECLAAEKQFGIKIIRWDDLNLKDDLDDIFALIRNLDFVVTTATAVHQMSAAVGAETLLITPPGAYNRFGLDYDPWFSNLHPVITDIKSPNQSFEYIKNYIDARSQQKSR